jgi:hypothetical protein
MKAVLAAIGGAEVLIEVLDDEVEVLGAVRPGRATQTTGVTEDLRQAYAKAKLAISEMAKDMGQELRQLAAATRPKQVELEFNMGFSATAGVWVVSGKGDCGLKVKMTWQLAEDA